LKSLEDIYALYRQRQSALSPVIERMREVKAYYNSEIVVPLPELNLSEKPAVANLIMETIDQGAMRVSSTLPMIVCPALYPRLDSGRGSTEWAGRRQKAIGSWWQESKMQRLLRRRARFLYAYGQSGVEIRPDFDKRMPKWVLRDPLNSFPSPANGIDDFTPEDVIYSMTRSLSWLERMYPDYAVALYATDRKPSPDTLYEVFEYIDGDEYVTFVVGLERTAFYDTAYETGSMPKKFVELSRVPNLAGCCPAVHAEDVALDQAMGQLYQSLGMYDAQAQLMALNLLAVRKGIFPDLAIQSRDNRPPQLADDEWKDGVTGEVNIILNGEVKAVTLPPGHMTGETQDRLERGIRISGGMPAQWGGETPTNIRTGRAGEITMSAQVDFRIQERQETLAFSMEAENRRAIAISKAYFGGRKLFFNCSLPKMKGQGDYDPAQIFETDRNEVKYSMPGADINTAVIANAQRVGAGLSSIRAAMEADPMIDDPEAMYDEIMAEGLERAVMSAIQQQAAGGQIPPGDVARIAELVKVENLPIYKAVEQAQKEAQERQAAQAPPGSPALQPGLAMPGMGAEASPAIPEGSEALSNLSSLLSQTRQPQGPSQGRPGMVQAGASS